MAVTKNCERCDKVFKTKPSHYERRIYCSRDCHNKVRETFEIRDCVICSVSFKYYPAAKNTVGKFCSLQCKGKGLRHKRISKHCIICETEFIPDISYKKKMFCSVECYGKSMAGTTKPSFWETASKEEQLERLKNSYDKYVVRNEEGCWGWKGCPSKEYGSLQYGGKYKTVGAHQASWILNFGDIPKGMFICHHCDNPICSRPDHLFLGTPTDNVHDMHRKGRNKTLKGERAFNAVLTEDDVKEILKELKEGFKIYHLSKKYHVSPGTIHCIKENKTWKHIKRD